jgi:uncharacterized protein with PIN domain
LRLLDAYALVAFLGDEPAAGEVEAMLRAGDCRIGLVNLAEAAEVVGRIHGVELDEVRETVEQLVGSESLGLDTPSTEVAWRAAALRQVHYKRGSCELSLADCFLIATASTSDEIATADPAVAAVARCEGLAVTALPDSSGHRP